MAKTPRKFGEQVRKFRKQRGVTQEALADLAKLDPKSVVQIEAGRRNPTLRTINKIARVLRVKPSELLN